MSVEFAKSIAYWAQVATIVAGVLTACFGFVLVTANAVIDRDTDSRIGSAQNEAAQARRETVQIRNDNIKLENKTEQIRGDNLKLQTELEGERIRRLRIEESLRPRSLTEEQRKALAAELRKWPPNSRMTIVWLGNDEAEAYARQLVEAFKAGGISTTLGTNSTLTMGHGIHIAKDGARTWERTLHAFAVAQIPHEEPEPIDGADIPYIVVGYK